ncbi:MAG TPA: winged helix-turn-helix domain-containing protein [Steroidobacteraceae bacterium]
MNAGPESAAAVAVSGYQVADLLIDLRVRRVTRDGRDLEIAGRSFDLLMALVRASPSLLSTEALMECVWPSVVVNPETVTQRVKLLRHALADDAGNPRYIAALRGFGYRIAAGVVPLTMLPPLTVTTPGTPRDEAEVGASGSLPAAVPVAPAPKRRRATQALLVLMLLGAMGAAATWWGLERPSGALVADVRASHPGSGIAPRPSVAVMPFVNLTGDPAKEYLGDGMAEELINTLGQVRGLKVPARTSTFAYKGRNSDIRRIARELDVATILEGSVRSAGEHLRVSARLVDATSGYQVWSQDYDRQFADLFKLQDDLAAQIVQALRRYVNTDLPAPVRQSAAPRDVQAYDLYLQSREVFRGTQATLDQALAFVDQALVRDPDFADALGHRAALRAFPAVMGDGPAALLSDVERDAARALVLDPNSAEGNATLEMTHALRRQWLDAEQSYRATMATSANDSYYRDFHSTWLLRPAGRLHQDEAELMVSYHLAPAYGYTLNELSVTESLLGHDTEAIRFAELFQELANNGAPMDSQEALPYVRRALRTRSYAQAAKWATQALSGPLRDAGGGQVIQTFCAALANPAKQAAARQALRNFLPRLLTSRDEERIKMFFVAALTMVKDLDGAYELMGGLLDRRLDRTGSGGYELSEIWTAEMRPFRQDPRFQALVTRLKLPDYWAQYGPPDDCDFKDGKLNCH